MQVSSVNYKNLNHEFRIDAEYYRSDVLKRLNVLDKHKNEHLMKLVDFVVGPFGSTVTADKYVAEPSFRYIRNKDIKDFKISDDEPVFIPKSLWETLPQYHVQENDLLITVVGTLGKVALATKKDVNSIFSCKSTVLRCRSINPYYLLAYLNSDTGKLFSLRGKRGVIQEGLNLSDLKEIKVFVPSDSFQLAIENKVRMAFALNTEADISYKESEHFLLHELGLQCWQPKHQLTFTKTYTETKADSRIDAEYYQPKYEDITKIIKNNPGGYDYLGDLSTLVGHPSNPPYSKAEEKDKTFIVAQKHLGNYFLNDSYWLGEDSKYTHKEFLVKNTKYILQQHDLVLYTVGAAPHLGKANIVMDVDVPATIGSFVTLVRVKRTKTNPFTLLVLLNSTIGRLLTNRFQRGMVQQYLYPNDLVNTPIPAVPEQVHNVVQQKVVESFNLRKQSMHLLEGVKMAVETAIEEGEDVALSWLNNQEGTQEADTL